MRRRDAEEAASRSARDSGARRPALDGIRAVAVLAVIGYHGTSRVSGGFLGVDVFFVLSGYLITSLLVGERLATGRIHFGRFWARRARRLLPAVLLLVAVVIAETALREPVQTFGARRDDIVATLLYYANWHFIATEQSYFAIFTGQSPLQHTWSLAIEEQFYLVWPLLVAGAALLWGRFLRPLLIATALGAVASAAWMATHYDAGDPTAVYFATGSRAHELLVGAFLAVLVAWRPGVLKAPSAARWARFAGPAAAVVVVAALVAADDHSRVYYGPGSFAFAIAVAAAIWAVDSAPGSPVARLLSLAPIAWIGTISYGLYLWHWPLLQWVQTSSRLPDGDAGRLIAIALTFVAATVSYYALERPVRRGQVPWLGLSAPRLALVAPLAIAVVVFAGFRATDVPDSIRAATRVQDNIDRVKCPQGSPAPQEGYEWCVRSEGPAGAPVLANIGDSTSMALYPGLQLVADHRDWTYVQAAKNGCSILPLAFPSDPDDETAVTEARECIGAIPRMLDAVRDRSEPDVWIASDRWMLLPVLDGDRLVPPDAPRHDTLVRDALRRRVAELTNDREQLVIVVMPPQGPPAECATQAEPGAECTSPAYTTKDPVTARVARIVERVARSSPRVAAVRIDDIVCPGGTCPAAIAGRLVRYDGIHFTEDFSRRLVPEIVRRAERAGISFEARR